MFYVILFLLTELKEFMAGFRNDTVYGTNVDFTGRDPPIPTILTDGQLLIGSTTPIGPNPSNKTNIGVGNITSSDGSITVTNGSASIDLSTNSLIVAFLMHVANNKVNVTGDGTSYTIDFDSIDYNYGSGASGHTFTAPVKGIYIFNWFTNSTGAGVSNTSMSAALVTTSQSTYSQDYVATGTASPFTPFYTNGSSQVLMNIGDTATVILTVGGSGKNITVPGGVLTAATSQFSGYLLAKVP